MRAHRFAHQVDQLLTHCRVPGGRRRYTVAATEQAGAFRQRVRDVDAGEAELRHADAQRLDHARAGHVQEKHRRPAAEVEMFLPALFQDLAHAHGYGAEIDVHRARIQALVAHGAVVGDVVEVAEVAHRDAAPGLFLVQEGLDDQAGGEDLVARRVEQVRARHVSHAHRLALAAAQAVLDVVVQQAEFALLQDQRFLLHQCQRRRVRVGRARNRASACPC